MATPTPIDSSQLGVRANADKAATPLTKNASPSPKKRKDKEAPSGSTDAPLLEGSKAVSGSASKRLKAAAKASSSRRMSTVLSAQKRRPTSALANGVAKLDTKEQAEVFSLAVHRGRFASWSPSAVSAGAASQDGTVAAICRENGDIEIWDAVNWKVLQVIIQL